METRNTQIGKNSSTARKLAFSTLVKSSRHKSGNPLNANAAKTEFQRLRKEKRRYSRCSAKLNYLVFKHTLDRNNSPS